VCQSFDGNLRPRPVGSRATLPIARTRLMGRKEAHRRRLFRDRWEQSEAPAQDLDNQAANVGSTMPGSCGWPPGATAA
jgi:hypothetical protein